jgi:hypothetical protein
VLRTIEGAIEINVAAKDRLPRIAVFCNNYFDALEVVAIAATMRIEDEDQAADYFRCKECHAIHCGKSKCDYCKATHEYYIQKTKEGK